MFLSRTTAAAAGRGLLRQRPCAFIRRRGMASPAPQFTTNPSGAAFKKLGSQMKRAVKISGITVASLTLATAIAWQSYHLYIEHNLQETPSELTYTARNLLHGAYIREHVSPDYEMAAMYVREVLRIALEEQHLDEHSDVVIRLRLRLAEDENRAGNVLDSITEYTRAWMLLSTTTNNQDDEIKMTTAKQIGDLYLRIGDYSGAEEFLAWAFHKAQQQQQKVDPFLRVTITCSLASLYAMQHEFKLAMPLLLSALKQIPEEESSSQWTCMKGIIQNQLSECMYGMGKSEEALGWAQASLESCTRGETMDKDDKPNRDCQECGGVVSNNLGMMLEVRIMALFTGSCNQCMYSRWYLKLKGEFDDAVRYYQQAVTFAASAADLAGQDQYSMNAARLKEQIQNQKNAGVTVASDITAAIEPEPAKKPASFSAWMSKLWK